MVGKILKDKKGVGMLVNDSLQRRLRWLKELWWSPFRQRGRRISKSNVKPSNIGGTDGAVRGEPSSLRLSRVATEVDKVKFG